jgi:pilus assembly protein Flp/PilA
VSRLILKARVWTDVNGQDLVEYALMSGFVAVAAGAIVPGISVSISRVFSNVASAMKRSASQS